MYAKTKVACYKCGAERWEDTEWLQHYVPVCNCGGDMHETSCWEYDMEYVEEQEEKRRREEWCQDRYR